MSFYKKSSFDFNGKIMNNKNFYIFKSTSSDDRSEIISKLEKYETTEEFFKFYTNKDINAIFKLYEEIDSIYSSLYSENDSKNIISKIDIYICNLSKIFLLSNLISKNRIILDKAIYRTTKFMDKFFLDNNINNNIKKKLNNYVLNLLGIQNKKSKKKDYPLLLLRDNYNKYNTFKIQNPNICILNEKGDNLSTEIKIIDHSINNSSNHEITHDITNNTYNNKSINNIYNNTNNNSKINEEDNNIIIEELTTPKFQYKEDTLFQQIINDKLNENDTVKESLNTGNENNEEVNKNMYKKESIHSLYTLASKSKYNQEEIAKGMNYRYKNLILDEKNIGNNNNINNKKSKFNTKRNSSKFMLTDYKVNNIEKNDIEEKKIESKKRTFSYYNSKSSKEKILIKDLLVFINDLFKKNQINGQEKLKLKQLIIKKSQILEKIFIEYNENNVEKLIKELKNLIK